MEHIIYHNPRCSKSRQTLGILQDKGAQIKIIEYLKNIPSKEELSRLISLLEITPLELIRKGETIFKENYKGKELSDTEWIDAMISHPKLIERPIVTFGKKAIIGRPPEKVMELI